MTRVWVVLLIGLGLSMLGTLTATDAISLREVFHTVPVLGPLVFTVRGAMGTTLAHTLEPLCAVLGIGVMLAVAATWGNLRVGWWMGRSRASASST